MVEQDVAFLVGQARGEALKLLAGRRREVEGRYRTNSGSTTRPLF
jgi:hypothetical protein